MTKLAFKEGDISADTRGDSSRCAALEAEEPVPWMISGENKTGNACETCCQYINAATCPDCGAAMVRLGSCFSCQSCGYESCGG